MKIYEFTEHNLVVRGERDDLIHLAELCKDAEGTLGDLRYQIEYAFDIDGVRSDLGYEEGYDDPDYADRYLFSVAKKVVTNNKYGNYRCPCCNKVVGISEHYCSQCGQKLDWRK